MAACPLIAPVPDPTQWILDQKQKTGGWDLAILGNLHSCNVSLRFLKPCWMQAHRLFGLPMISICLGVLRLPQYHDCTQFLKGCDDKVCPKFDDQYPTSNGRIRQHYLQRNQLFKHPGIQLATHSRWSARLLRERFSSQRVLKCLWEWTRRCSAQP